MGMICVTPFMNPAEQYEAAQLLRREGGSLREVILDDGGRIANLDEGFADGGYVFWGGYATAERKRLFTLPAYLFYTAETIFDITVDEDGEKLISALSVVGSGYEKLTHRDYLGAILGEGVKRESVGDIVCADPSGDASDSQAVVFAMPSVVKLLLSDADALTSVGRDKVKLSETTVDYGFFGDRKFGEISGVIANPRLDCVVALLCGLSREKAKTAVASGLVMLNYAEILSADKEINEGDIVSVRGYGRFEIRAFDGRTKKDRLRVFAVKYI